MMVYEAITKAVSNITGITDAPNIYFEAKVGSLYRNVQNDNSYPEAADRVILAKYLTNQFKLFRQLY